MRDARRTQIRRTAIAVLILGTFVAAVVAVLSSSRDLADKDRRPGDACLYRALGRELCGRKAVDYCRDLQRKGDDRDRSTRATCAGIIRTGGREAPR